MKSTTTIVRKGIILLVFAVTVVVAWGAWRLHPWVQPGRARAIGYWELGDNRFQVWQRKNADLFEAYATGLFVQTKGGQWRSFCLDHQDYYSPKIELQANGSLVAVLRNGTTIGNYDTATANFKRTADGATINAVVISNDPPADWWLK